MRGTLFLIAGPSGAGKDTLIDGARAALASDPRVRFVHRVITRAGDAGEVAWPQSPDAFARLKAQGAFALAWDSHGLSYGVPADIAEDLARGRHVAVNVSRGAIAEARARFAPVRVLLVTAPVATLAARLAARGRESEAGIAERLARAPAYLPQGPDVTVIDNAGPVATGVAALVSALGTNAQASG